jgi:GT2 family glycosyltransferase
MTLRRLGSSLAGRLSRSSTLKRLGRIAPVGMRGMAKRLLGLEGRAPESNYGVWLERERAEACSSDQAATRVAALTYRPLVSVVVPVHDPELRDLARALRSVEDQFYPHWEICVADDASQQGDVREFLESSAKEKKIQLIRLESSCHIAGATNAAIELATGEFLAFLDHDDVLAPTALLEVVEAIAHDPDLDVVYSDHDILDRNGVRHSPSFKPDWSPELLLAYMYLGHLKVYRTCIVRELGGLRKGFEGSADYDLALRLTEKTDRIHHVPKVLYHWREAPRSMARGGKSKIYSFESGRRALQETLDRRRVPAEAVQPGFARRARIGLYHLGFRGGGGEKVSIVIPTRDRVDLLSACIRSIEEKTTYGAFEIVIVDNESCEPETLDYLSRTRHRVISFSNEGKFDFAAMNNFAVAQIDSEFVVLLNNDTVVATPNWLEGLLGFGGIPGVGAVGAKLLYPDGRIQHAGVVLGVQGLTGHALQPLLDVDAPAGYSRVPRNYLAVTAACMLTRKSLFDELGGLDAEHLRVGWNDVDYCLRLVERGYRIVLNPEVVLRHFESQSRGDDKDPEEVVYMKRRWSGFIERDPYFNPNFSRAGGDFRIKTDPDESRSFYYGEPHAS